MMCVIGCDLDDTLVNTTQHEQSALAHLQMLGVPFDCEVYAERHCWLAATGLDDVLLTSIFERQVLYGLTPDELIPGALEGFGRLSALAQVHVISARSTVAVQATWKKLSPLFGARSIGLHGTSGTSKAAIIESLGVTVLLDDSFRDIERILRDTKKTICMQFPSYMSGGPSPRVRHERVIRLDACDHTHPDMPIEQKHVIWRWAWKQAEEIIRTRFIAGVAATAS